MSQSREMNQGNRTPRFTSPMSNTARGITIHDRFSSSIVGPNRESPNPNEPMRAMGTNNISPLPISRFSGSHLLLDQRVGTGYYIPPQTTDHNIAAAAAVAPPHCNCTHCHYHNHNNSNSFQNPPLDLTLGVGNYNGSGGSSVAPSALQVGEGSSSAWQMPPNGFAFSEFVVGESSNAGASRAAANGIPKCHAGIESPSLCTCITCPLHGYPRPDQDHHHHHGHYCNCHHHRCHYHWGSSTFDHDNGDNGRLTVQTFGDNPQAFVEANYTMPSFGYIPADHGQQYSQYQHYYVLTNYAETSSFLQEFSSYHSFGDYGPPWSSVMWPRTAPYWTDAAAAAAAAQLTVHNIVHTPTGIYLLVPDPQTGRGYHIINAVHNGNSAANRGSAIDDGNNNGGGFLGNGSSSHPSSSFVVPASHQLSSLARTWMQGLNVHQEYMRLLLEYQAAAASAAAAAAAANHTNDVAPLPPNNSHPGDLRQDIYNAISRLRTGGSIQLEELLILDYSIILNLIGSGDDDLDDEEFDWDAMQYEDIVNMEDEIGNVDVGLTEDQILAHIELETFVSIANEEHQNDTCSICQQDYVDGEQIGRLNCRHVYHLECIQLWLVIKNLCPICKQVALTIVNEDEEGENEE